MLRDRKYCAWLLEQDWFRIQYHFLFERIEKYDLTNEEDLTIHLTENEMKYIFVFGKFFKHTPYLTCSCFELNPLCNLLHYNGVSIQVCKSRYLL